METVRDRLQRIADVDQGKPRKHVVVLGAGMAGLTAAYELASLGHTVSVIEATNRAGGRVWTKRFSPTGEYHELGAMRIPASHEYTRHYIDQVGLTSALRPFVTSHRNLNCFYHLRGVVCRIKDAPRCLFDAYRLSALERQVAEATAAPAIFGLHLENALRSLSEEDRAGLFGQRFLTDGAAFLETESLGEFLQRCVESQDALELIGGVTGLEPWWDMAVAMFLRDEIRATGEGLEEIAGGLDLLPTKIAARLPAGTIRYNLEVLSVELAGDRVRLRTRPTLPPKDGRTWDSPPSDAPPNEEFADFVVCSLPFGVLRRMDLRGLSYLKVSAIRNLNYASSTKVLLHCTERFWELGGPDKRIIGGASMSDGITRATYYPSDHAVSTPLSFAVARHIEGFRGVTTTFTADAIEVDTKKFDGPGPGVLVGSYCWGRDAQRLGALPPVERAGAVIDAVRAFHPELDRHVDDAASMYWDDFRWSRGAFCFMHPGDLRSYYHAAIRPEGRVHFAGEHCSLDQGWIQGAAESGVRVVEEIVSRPT